MDIIGFIKQPWPWYIAGPLIGLAVPALLITGNKAFGVSSSLRHICAACLPSNITFFRYDWKKEAWNLYFVLGILLGGIFTVIFLANPTPVQIDSNLATDLAAYGITDHSNLLPREIFSWKGLITPRGFIMIVAGGFLVGFGTRYAGGCTSGHSIMGMSTLQWPSLVATCCFMVGGFIMANLILPQILSL
jgi:uncharacterized protein